MEWITQYRAVTLCISQKLITLQVKYLHNEQIGAEKCVCDYQGGS